VTGVILYVAASLLAFALVERRLKKTVITGPMIFVVLGVLASVGFLGIITDDSANATVNIVVVLFQGTLALVLFTDAAALDLTSWRKDADLPSRLLGIGLPLTIAVGAVSAALLFTDLSFWEAAMIGAMIAPTDAALGAAVIANPRVPERIRGALDVESGLNDGISLPFLLIFMAIASQDSGVGVVETFASAIGIAVVVGLIVGALGAWLLIRASNAGWAGTSWSGIAVISIAVIAFVVANSNGGSGFISTFVAGMVYGSVTRGKIRPSEFLAADIGSGLVQTSFLMFGALIILPELDSITWQVVVMVVIALTVARMVPVALSMIGTGLRVPTLLYMGWFGPRGLATIVYAAVVVTEANLSGESTIVMVSVVTVGVSIFVHGLSSYPGSQKYADWYEAQDHTDMVESKPLHHRLRVGDSRLRVGDSRLRSGDSGKKPSGSAPQPAPD
jgi:NhaP-type Na+/H+ or K+/H+ antiporter